MSGHTATPTERWRNCPSTHCERARECRSPHECSSTGKGVWEYNNELGEKELVGWERPQRPAGSNADEWHLFLSQYLDNRAAFPTGLTYVAVQIAEALDPRFGGPTSGVEAEAFIQAEIDAAPEPLKRLGQFLADALDEDHWKTAERMLLGGVNSHADLVRALEEIRGGKFDGAGTLAVSGSWKLIVERLQKIAADALATLTSRKVG